MRILHEITECDICLTEYLVEDVNAGEVPMHKVGGANVCHECIETCNGDCGEYIDDTTPASWGPPVRIRRWEVDGKLGSFHAICAVDYLLQSWTGNPKTTADYLSRFQIGEIVADAFPAEVAR